MKKKVLFVGLDVHAKDITIAVAEGGANHVGRRAFTARSPMICTRWSGYTG